MNFTIEIPNAEPKGYNRKQDAIRFVDKQAAEHGLTLQVVDTETNLVVHVGNPVEGRNFHPNERRETPRSTTAPHIPGFMPAYHRVRIDATVYQGIEELGNKGKWKVYDGRSGVTQDVANTKAANELTKAMRHGLVLS